MRYNNEQVQAVLNYTNPITDFNYLIRQNLLEFQVDK